MSTIAEIESAIEQLPVNQLQELAAWLEQYQATKVAALATTKLSSQEIAEIHEALGEAEKEFGRGEGRTSEAVRRQLGIL